MQTERESVRTHNNYLISLHRAARLVPRSVHTHHTHANAAITHTVEINEVFKKYTRHPVLAIIDVQPQDDMGIPVDAYVAVEEVKDDGTPTQRSFQHLPSEIGAEEVCICICIAHTILTSSRSRCTYPHTA